MTENARTGSQAFRPRARLIRTLGRELISNEIIALQELIKNAYDADAKNVRLYFTPPLLPGAGAVIVSDDGEGMTLDVLQTAWMEPATLSKVKKTRSDSGRRVTGEKGIGRFASARVASLLELTSVSRINGRRIFARFDWGAFDDESHYLDEITCEWREDSPSDPTPGTELRLIRLHDDWTREKGSNFRKLRSELARLVSPISTEDFRIFLDLPEDYDEFSGEVAPPGFLSKPKYWITGTVTADGVIDAVYEGPDGETAAVLDRGEQPRIRLPGGRRPSCGPFSFEFRVWDRTNEDLREVATEFGSTLRDIRRDLDAASGIRIYRDEFRVLLPDNDWLRLDIRRVQNPTLRVSNNQVVGVVSITRDENPALIDQTNRQGIVDSPAFEDFKTSVREVLARLETRRDLVRRPEPEPTRSDGLFSPFNLSGLRGYVTSRYADDKELARVLDETENSLSSGVENVKIVLARYRRLATLGQLVDVILHEGRTPLTAISNAIGFAKRDVDNIVIGRGFEQHKDKVRTRLQTVAEQLDRLSDMFRRISPFSGRKAGKPKKTTMEKVIGDVFALAHERILELGVAAELPAGETLVTVDPSEMQSLFYNLLENSLYWLEKVDPDERKIRVELVRSPWELQVVFADNGPGVDEAIQRRIFDPYFSTRPDGVGLGLALAGELATEYGGSLELVDNGPLNGATFVVTLRKRIGEPDA